MKTEANDKQEANELRQKAENELVGRKLNETIVEADNLKLIHELQVHQIELEMQNEELIIAREQAEAAMEKYTDLYDFAPSGYISLSKEGEIIDLNFSAAKMLGNDRTHLKNKRLALYVSHESLELWNDFLEEIFRRKKKQSCELLLLSSTDKPCYVHVDALVSQNSNTCQVTLIDITKRKSMEVELESSIDQYKNMNKYYLGRELRMVVIKEEVNELLTKSGCEEEYLI